MHSYFELIVPELKQYSIPLAGLKQGISEYSFVAGNEFFDSFESSEIKKGNVDIHLTLHKNPGSLSLDLSISGNVEVSCDRCLGLYDEYIEHEVTLYAQFESRLDYEEDDIFVLPHGTDELNITQIIYDYILLSLPIRRVHPDNEKGESLCDKEMIEKLNELKIRDESETEIDPRWSDLKKLLNKN